MNDDYFVNRDVAITDLFNEYGGTIVRVESTLITRAYTADTKMDSWAEGVIHTNHFTIRELDLMHEDEVSSSAVLLWKRQSDDVVQLNSKAIRRGSSPLPSFTGPSQRHAMWTMLELFDEDQSGNLTIPAAYTVEEVMAAYASKSFGVIRPHYYATHAPFVYCTNMFRYFATRYQREYAQSMFLHRSRGSTDLYVPFLYNAFVMARPWVASPRFPSYLLLQREMEREVDSRAVQLVDEAKRAGEAVDGNSRDALPQARRQAVEEMKKTLLLDPIQLDNCDGCAPATMLVGSSVNGCLFGRFTDNLGVNQLYMRQIAREKPLFFNVNSGWATPKAADQLRSFLQTKFPHSVFLEKTDAPPSDAEAAMTQMFKSLMELPVIGVVSYEEGVCPLVRSLSLAFAGHHRGRVHVRRPRHSLGEVDATLKEVRAELRYTPMSALATVGCTFSSKVNVEVARRGETLVNLARQALSSDEGLGVALPSTCGGVGGGAAALRVRGFVIDARTPHLPIREVHHIPEALAVPGQTLALEDFRAVRVGPADGDVVLVLAREDAAAKAVHWVTGASENDLLLTFPLPVEAYEDLDAAIRWLEWQH
ncbi:hypothetical protein ABL78_5975 [Leptomonas seymouri]|uniref:Stealth protein CR3 conserved region 3 domain-containing protein n=1 Tax=Leptomonas seymouri TaxID=5684 RepID=A0A0N1I2Q7_LEPSE|nr:hypothetical protein ABL78_5975 [Leptomonas seymouri]|eukprot:KPI84960.1 hypothetical protein ABL78_5975 [Leptomonas seymouri]